MEEQDEKSPLDSSGLDLTVLNSATNEPIVHKGETAVLVCTLTNNTGGPISFVAGSKPSKLEIYLPEFYEQDDLNKMQINLGGWDFAVNSDHGTLVLTCAQEDSCASGKPLSFQITGAQSSEPPPKADQVEINPSGMTGNNIPPQVQTDSPLSLQDMPDGNNADLRQALDATLENEGTVYISVSDDLLVSNTLSLTLKNKGDQPLFAGSGAWPTNPQALVSFVYGNKAGALAPDDPSTPKERSAWSIQTGEIISEDNSVVLCSRLPSKHPQWWLTPNANHPGILGTDDQASITFDFTHVISCTPVGHTQMYVNCSDFPGYNDALFVLDIDKRELPSPGLIRFTSDVHKVTVHSSNDPVTIPLSWTMTGVSKITLDFDFLPSQGSNLNSVNKTYTDHQPPLQRDSYQLVFSRLQQSGMLIVTCTAYPADNSHPSDIQQTVVLDFPPVVTSYTGELQPDGKLLLTWTSQGATKVALNPDLIPQTFDANSHYPLPNPPLPLLKNYLYALTAMNDQEQKGDPRVFTTTQKFGVARPAIGGFGRLLRGITVSPDSSHVFVTNMQDNNVSVVEVNLNNNPPFRVLPTRVQTGRQPGGIAVSPLDGKYVFVANTTDSSVTVIDGKPPFQPLHTIHAGVSPECLAVSPDGRYVFVPYDDSDEGGFAVSVIDTANAFKVIQGPTLGQKGRITGVATSRITDLAGSSDGCYLFVSHADDDSLSVLQVEAGANPPYRVLSRVQHVGNNPGQVAVSPDDHCVFVASLDGVAVIEVRSGPSFQVLSPPLSAGTAFSASTVSPDGRFLFAASGSGVWVWVIDKDSDPAVKPLQTLRVVTSGTSGPIAASPEGHFIFVADAGADTLLVVEAVAASM